MDGGSIVEADAWLRWHAWVLLPIASCRPIHAPMHALRQIVHGQLELLAGHLAVLVEVDVTQDLLTGQQCE